jgi:hypothetical protein
MVVYWSVVGFSLVSVLSSRRNLLRNALLTPLVGAAANVLLVLWANRAGMPVKYAGPVVTAVLSVAAVLALLRVRPVLPVSRLKPFLVVLVIAALANGYPLLRFGFNWLSYCNDDMANYSLGSNLFLNHGFSEFPNAQKVIEDRDPTLFYWYFYVYSGFRSGTEENLAWAASSTGLTTHQVFMPTILALHLVLIAATGALVMRGRKYRLASLVVCAWMAVSALTTLGTMYQLIAQVFGLGLLAGVCALLLRPFDTLSRRALIRACLLLGVLCGALSIVYPEVIPFLVLSFAIYHLILLIRRREAWKPVLAASVSTGGFSLVFLGTFLPSTISTLHAQATGGVSGTPFAKILFPYFLWPSGFANLWGFYPIGRSLVNPLLNLYVAAGAVLFVLCLAGAVWLAWSGEASAVICLIMAALAIRLFSVRADFGLYKVAMYIQPFLISTAVLGWFQVVAARPPLRCGTPARRMSVLLGPLALVIALGMNSQAYYVDRSIGTGGGGLVEIPYASESGLLSGLMGISKQGLRPMVISDTSNVVLAKYESLYLGPSSAFFLAEDYFRHIVTGHPITLQERFVGWMDPQLATRAQSLFEERQTHFKTVQFDMHEALSEADTFEVRRETADLESKQFTLLESGPEGGVLNRRTALNEMAAPVVRATPSERVRNHLAFVSSDFGKSYYFAGPNRLAGRVSAYQPERDYFFPKSTMAALGRVSLFRVLNPARQLRLVVEYTASLNADRDNRIPPASVIGASRMSLPFQGRGSARLFSPVIQPQTIEGGCYLALNMGTWGNFFPQSRAALVWLYGRDILPDFRRIVGFARDISVLSEEEYETLRTPEHIQGFPADLANKNLEYSGVYEDGWVAESSFVVLKPPAGPCSLVVRATIPRLHGVVAASQMTVLLDGTEIARRSLGVGEVRLRIPIASGNDRRRIDLFFDRADNLPAPDNRPVSAQLQFVGFAQ